MADWGTRLLDHALVETAGVTTATSTPTTITTGGTNTKGSWTELIASTSFDAVGIYLHVAGGIDNAIRGLIDLGIGGAGSEVVIVENFAIADPVFFAAAAWVYLPIAVPAGTRLAARTQTTVNGKGFFVQAVLVSSGGRGAGAGFGRCTSYGVVSSGASGGTSVDPGGTAHTKSNTELAASTTHDAKAVIVMINNNDAGLASGAFVYWLVDLCIGGSGSEQVIVSNLSVVGHGSSDRPGITHLGPFYVSIPAGSRLSVSAQCSSIDAGDRVLQVSAYCFS